jgi:hypothetical protein
MVSSTRVIIQKPVPKFIADGAMETDGAGAESEGGGEGAGGGGGLNISSDDESTKKEQGLCGYTDGKNLTQTTIWQGNLVWTLMLLAQVK